MTDNLLRLRLVASQTATPEAVRLDHAVEDAIHALERVHRHIVYHPHPSDFAIKRIRTIACRLLEGCGKC